MNTFEQPPAAPDGDAGAMEHYIAAVARARAEAMRRAAEEAVGDRREQLLDDANLLHSCSVLLERASASQATRGRSPLSAAVCGGVRDGDEPGGAEALAARFHEAYERLAPEYGYETRKDSAVPWADVPEPNRSLMVAVAADVLARTTESCSPVSSVQEKKP